MKYLLSGLLVLISTTAFAQVDLSPELLQTIKMLALSEGDIEGVQKINFSLDPKDKDCPPELKKSIEAPQKLFLVDNKKQKLSPWSFSVRTTLTGPRGKLEKTFMDADKGLLIRSKLDGIIQGNFKSYDDRMKAVSQSCAGLNDFQKISMSSMLAGRLSSIYDYSRAGGGSDAIIKPEEQWDALKSNQAKGVCRDASITVSQFLIACGFKKEQIAIKSYRTQDSGHQVTSVRTKDGEFTINWDELYEVKDGDFGSPEPSVPNTGLFYTLYDPETGRIIEQKRTELGDALKLLSGGKPTDPVYTPNLIVAEAAYGGFAAKVFQTADKMGNTAKGAAASYNSHTGNERSFTDISYGGAYARNEKTILFNESYKENLTQDILFFQMEAKTQKAFPLFNTKTGKLSVAPAIGMSSDASLSLNNFRGNKTKSTEFYSEYSGGATVYYDTDPVKMNIGGEVVTNFTNRMYNSENEKSSLGVYVNRYIVHAGASWENDRLVASADSNMIIATTEKQKTFGAGIKDKKTSTSCQAIYSVYDRSYGSREDYLITKCQKDFSIQRIGQASFDAGSKLSLNQQHKDFIIGIGATLKWK